MDFLHFKAKKVIDIVLMDVVWAAYYIASNWMVAKTQSPFVTGMIMRASALVFLIIYVLIKKEFRDLFKQGKVTWLLFLIGVLGFTTDAFANIGLKYGSISTGTVLLKTDIIMANLITIIIFKQKLHINEWVGSLIMLGGVVLVLGVGSKDFQFNWYDLFFIASALSVTIDAFLIKHVRTKYGTSSDIIAFYNNFVVLILFTLATFISQDFRFMKNLEATYPIFLVALAGGLAQTCIYIFYYINLSRMAVWKVKLALLFIPIISLIFGLIIYHETITWLQGLGIGIMLIGGAIVVIHIKVKKHRAILAHTSYHLDTIPNDEHAKARELAQDEMAEIEETLGIEDPEKMEQNEENINE